MPEQRKVIERPVMFGTAELIPDRLRPTGWTVAVDGVSQSYVDLADPAHLELAITSWIGRVIDLRWPPGKALSAVHVGGAGCTVPRYLAATRPDTTQTVFDLDGELVEFVREHLALDSVPGVDVRVRDGGAGIRAMASGTADLIVLDVFRGGDIVTDMATVAFVRQTARVLRPGGLYAVNVWDGDELNFTRQAVATLGESYPHVAVVSEAGVFLRARPGNLLLIAAPDALPVADLAEQGKQNRFFCVTGQQLTAMHGAAPPITEADPPGQPVRPVARWGRGSRFTRS